MQAHFTEALPPLLRVSPGSAFPQFPEVLLFHASTQTVNDVLPQHRNPDSTELLFHFLSRLTAFTCNHFLKEQQLSRPGCSP